MWHTDQNMEVENNAVSFCTQTRYNLLERGHRRWTAVSVLRVLIDGQFPLLSAKFPDVYICIYIYTLLNVLVNPHRMSPTNNNITQRPERMRPAAAAAAAAVQWAVQRQRPPSIGS